MHVCHGFSLYQKDVKVIHQEVEGCVRLRENFGGLLILWRAWVGL